jgi:hypothetical protein
MLGGRLKQGDPDQEQVVFTKLEKYPVFEKYRPLMPDGTGPPLFDGFFLSGCTHRTSRASFSLCPVRSRMTSWKNRTKQRQPIF